MHALFVWLFGASLKGILPKKTEKKKRRKEHGIKKWKHPIISQSLLWIMGDPGSEGASCARKSDNHTINKESAVWDCTAVSSALEHRLRV